MKYHAINHLIIHVVVSIVVVVISLETIYVLFSFQFKNQEEIKVSWVFPKTLLKRREVETEVHE